MDLTIRHYVETDKQAASELMALLQDHLHAYDPFKQYRAAKDFDAGGFMEFIVRDDAKHEGKIFIAEYDGHIVGIAAGSVVSEDEERMLSHYPGKEGMLYELCVAEGHRSLGIGQKLIHAMEEHFRSIGCKTMRLECLAANTKAMALYRREGLTERTVCMIKTLE
jgi:ribosomal protein S18 acetylase RimI-like enzyme